MSMKAGRKGVDYQTLSVTAYGGISIIAWLMMSLGASLLAFIFVRPGRVLRRIGGTPWHAPSLSNRAARVQAASRSLLARLAPPEMQAEFFGLFTLAGKVTAFVGSALVGWVTYVSGSQRAGIATILPFFAVGAIMLLFVKERRLEAPGSSSH